MAKPSTKPTTQLNSWDEELAQASQVAAKAESKLGGSGNFFATKGGQLMFDGNPLPGNTIDSIVLASVAENCFYEGKFDPKTPASPVCFAFEPEDPEEEMVPHKLSSKPQHTDCATCPHNEFGTADGGTGAGKACKNLRRLALIPAGKAERGTFVFNTPEDLRAAAIGYLKVPPTSTKEWGRYVKTLAAGVQRPPYAVASRVSLVPAGTTFKVTIDMLEKAPATLRDAILAQRELALNDIRQPYAPNEARPATTANKTKGRALR